MLRTVLITNLNNVNVGDARTYTHALLLQDRGSDKESNPLAAEPRFRARGFGTQGTMPVFDMEIPSLEYEFRPDEPPPWAAAVGGTMLTTHGILLIRREDRSYSHDSTIELRLDCGTVDGRPIDFEHHEGDPRDRATFENLWARLEAKVAHYWTAPFIRTVQSVRTELVQRACPVEMRGRP